MVLSFISALLLVAGCATVDPRHDYERAVEHIEKATGASGAYSPDDEESMKQRVIELLEGGLTADEAVQICLLNNPSLHAMFLEIGMARADVVQAGLFSNPSLGLALRLPAGGGLANIDAGIAQNIADLWQIPARKRAAERSLDQTILQIARDAADLAADAKSAYYTTAGTRQLYDIAQENLLITKELLELAVTRQQAGAGNVIDVNLARSQMVEAELVQELTRLAAAEAGRTLATLLGLKIESDTLVLVDPLPDIPPEPPDAESLVPIARQWRLDLRAAEQAVAAAEARLQEQYRLIIPEVEFGVAFERDARQQQRGRKLLADTARASIAGGGLRAPDIEPRSQRQRNKRTDFVIGPSIGLELPIFDQNQAQIAKARFAYTQAIKNLEALDLVATQQIRGAIDRARTRWRIIRLYRDSTLPLARDNLDLSRKSYQAGKTSFLSVIEAQKFFLDSRKRYVVASRDAAVTIPELERAIGLPFDLLMSSPSVENETGRRDVEPEDNTEP